MRTAHKVTLAPRFGASIEISLSLEEAKDLAWRLPEGLLRSQILLEVERAERTLRVQEVQAL